MSGRHKFADLEAGMPPARRARIDRLAQKLRDEVAVAESGPRSELAEAVLRVLREHPGGLTRREIGRKLGLDAGKAAERSIAEALTALADGKKVAWHDRKFVPA